jgi:serine/threonine protein kinase
VRHAKQPPAPPQPPQEQLLLTLAPMPQSRSVSPGITAQLRTAAALASSASAASGPAAAAALQFLRALEQHERDAPPAPSGVHASASAHAPFASPAASEMPFGAHSAAAAPPAHRAGIPLEDEDGLPLPPQAMLPFAPSLTSPCGGAGGLTVDLTGGLSGGFTRGLESGTSSTSVLRSASPLPFELDPSALRSMQGSPATTAAEGSSPGHHTASDSANVAYGAAAGVRGSPPALFDASGSEAGFAVGLNPFASHRLTSPDAARSVPPAATRGSTAVAGEPVAALAAVATGFREYRARWQGLSVAVHCLDFSAGSDPASGRFGASMGAVSASASAFSATATAIVPRAGSATSPPTAAADACHRLFHLCLGRVRRELALLSSLRHPNCQLFIGATTAPPRVGVVMEHLRTGSLAAFLHGGGAGGGGSGDGVLRDVGSRACSGFPDADSSEAAGAAAVLAVTEGPDASSGAGERPAASTGIEGASGSPRASSGSLSRLADSRSSSDADGEGLRRQGFASGDTGATGDKAASSAQHTRLTCGQTLQHKPEPQQPPLPWSLIRSIALDVARGLCYLHSLKMHAYVGDYRPAPAASGAPATTVIGAGSSLGAAAPAAGAASAVTAGSALVPFVHGGLHPGACMLEEGLRVKIGCVRHTAITAAVEAARRRLGSVLASGSGAVPVSGSGGAPTAAQAATQAAAQAWGPPGPGAAGSSAAGAGAGFRVLPQQRCPAAIALSRCLPVAYTAPEVLAWLGYADGTAASAVATPDANTAGPSPAAADAAASVQAPLTQAIDVFSFGVLLWELVERRSPVAALLEPQAEATELAPTADPPASTAAAPAGAESAVSAAAISTAALVAARLLAGARPPLPDPLGPRLGLGAGAPGASGGGSSRYGSGSGGTAGLGSRRAFLALMQRCWAARPADRPTFATIVSTLERLQPY